MSRLQILNGMCNDFHGSIPDGFGDLKRLQTIQMDQNKLTGKLPTQVYVCNMRVVHCVWVDGRADVALVCACACVCLCSTAGFAGGR